MIRRIRLAHVLVIKMRMNAVERGLIQRFYNEHFKPGEYLLSAMLACPPGGPIQNLPMPIVRHQRNAYSVYNDKNTLYMKQLEVDFC